MTTPRDEELRLALVMNGGVSLAVWIGGVAHEINRFVGETHPVYRHLLELTSTRARVDVISGTSAGGVNGAALALSCVYDTTLYSLRDLWLSKGSFADLLRKSEQKDAASLLDGDGYFLPALHAAFTGLLRKEPRPADQAPMDLALTSTMLRAEPHSRLDDLGERIHDGHHRAVFHYERGARDAFMQPQELAKSLAGAARASASFPVAFEPRWFDKGEFRNAHTGEAPKVDRYLIDGGVLDNKPLRGALQAIFKMPATGNVRRVLAYIAPDPAVTAAPESDDAKEPPTITEVATASLLGIPGAQSITDQLQQIDEHNTAVRRQRHTFAWLAANLTTADLEATARSYFSAYRERRIDGLLDFVIEEVAAGLREATDAAGRKDADDHAPEVVAFGKRTREWLKELWRSEPAAGQAWVGRIPNADDAWSFDLGAAEPTGWTWGNYAIEFIGSVMLDLLRRTQRLAHLQGQSGNVVIDAPSMPLPGPGDAANVANADAETIDWDLQDTMERNRRSGAAADAARSPLQGLGGLWERAYKLVADAETLRQSGSRKLRDAAPALLAELRALDEAQARMSNDDMAAVRKRIVSWVSQSVAPADGLDALKRRHAAVAARMAQLLVELSRITKVLAGDAIVTPRPEEAAQLNDLKRLHELLFGSAPTANELMRRLLQLEIGHYSMAGRSQTIDVAVELVQISGRGQSPWGGPATPSTKLTGMQLAHFGAFYRKSWRANDWMMGRLDGIDRIIRVALNPGRLHRLYAGRKVRTVQGDVSASEYVCRFVESLAIGCAAPSHCALLAAEWQPADIRHELSFLDSPAARVPEALPLCAAALTRRLHLEVLCKELPTLARSAKDDEAGGAVLGKHGAALVQRVRWDLSPLRQFANGWAAVSAFFANKTGFATRMMTTAVPPLLMSPKAAVEAFSQCPVGSELLQQEVGSDLMTRTAGQALTVAHAATVGKHFGMASVGGAMKVLTLPVRFFYLLASRLTSESRTSAAVASALLFGGFLFVLGAAFMAKPPAGLAVAGWSMLIGWFGTTLIRQGTITAGAALAAFAALFFFLTRDTGDSYGFILWILIVIALLVWTPAWFAAGLGTLATLWWTTGQPAPSDIGAALCRGPFQITGCHVTGTPAHAEQFVVTLGPVFLVFVLSLLAVFGARRKR